MFPTLQGALIVHFKLETVLRLPVHVALTIPYRIQHFWNVRRPESMDSLAPTQHTARAPRIDRSRQATTKFLYAGSRLDGDSDAVRLWLAKPDFLNYHRRNGGHGSPIFLKHKHNLAVYRLREIHARAVGSADFDPIVLAVDAHDGRSPLRKARRTILQVSGAAVRKPKIRRLQLGVINSVPALRHLASDREPAASGGRA